LGIPRLGPSPPAASPFRNRRGHADPPRPMLRGARSGGDRCKCFIGKGLRLRYDHVTRERRVLLTSNCKILTYGILLLRPDQDSGEAVGASAGPPSDRPNGWLCL
jgi:hypothetical protein